MLPGNDAGRPARVKECAGLWRGRQSYRLPKGGTVALGHTECDESAPTMSIFTQQWAAAIG